MNTVYIWSLTIPFVIISTIALIGVLRSVIRFVERTDQLQGHMG